MCRLFRHNWLKWSHLIQGTDGHKVQFRACQHCGIVQFRDLGYCKGSATLQANEALTLTGFEPRPWWKLVKKDKQNDRQQLPEMPAPGKPGQLRNAPDGADLQDGQPGLGLHDKPGSPHPGPRTRPGVVSG